MRTQIFLFFLLSSFNISAQDAAEFRDLYNDLKVLSSDDMEGRKTGTRGNIKAQKYIINRFTTIGLTSFGNSYKHQFDISGDGEEKSGTNLIGYQPGNSGQTIVVSAHFDHLGIKSGEVFNGSDDNASGVSLMLFIAEKLKKIELRHTIIFAALDSEEQGLLGAKAFVKKPPIPIDSIVFNLNLDMVSRNEANEIFASGSYHNPWLKEYIRDWRIEYPVKVRLGHDNPRDKANDWTNSSDHAAFHKRGIPYLYFGVEDHVDYHKSSDTYEKTNFSFFADVALVVSDVVLKLDKINLISLPSKE